MTLGKEGEKMISLSQVEDQLKKVGCNFRFWGRPEIRELCKILMPGEIIAQAANGRYENGNALLVATDHRLLLVDKKPMFLTLEDVRFDMIAEIDFSAQLLTGSIRIMTPNRTLRFTSLSHVRLRNILNYTQQRVSDIRQHYMQRQFQPQRGDEYAAPVVGGLALQGNTYGEQYGMQNIPYNPYTRSSFTMRKRRLPKFY